MDTNSDPEETIQESVETSLNQAVDNIIVSKSTDNNHTVYQYATELCQLYMKNDSNIIDVFLSKFDRKIASEIISIQLKERGDKNALIVAIRLRVNIKIIELLVSYDINLNDTSCNLLKFPLLHAIMLENLDYVKILQKKGADICLIDFSYISVGICYVWPEDISEFLLETMSNVNMFDPITKENLLHKLITSKNKNKLSYIKILIRRGIDIEMYMGEYWKTPLFLAVSSYKIEVVKLLLENGAYYYITDHNGRTLIDHAIKNEPEDQELGGFEGGYRGPEYYINKKKFSIANDMIEILNNHRKNIENRITFLMMVREFVEDSLFHDDYLPLDLFRVILRLAGAK